MKSFQTVYRGPGPWPEHSKLIEKLNKLSGLTADTHCLKMSFEEYSRMLGNTVEMIRGPSSGYQGLVAGLSFPFLYFRIKLTAEELGWDTSNIPEQSRCEGEPDRGFAYVSLESFKDYLPVFDESEFVISDDFVYDKDLPSKVLNLVTAGFSKLAVPHIKTSDFCYRGMVFQVDLKSDLKGTLKCTISCLSES